MKPFEIAGYKMPDYRLFYLQYEERPEMGKIVSKIELQLNYF
jgi:hypothetical protein